MRPTSRRGSLVAVSLALAALPLFAVADDPGATAAKALRAAEIGLRDRDWAKAAADLRGVRTQFPAAPEAAEAWVLEARALFLAGKHREALDAAAEFLKSKGDAAWAGRMKATMADAYAALKSAGDEVRVLRERAEFLTGDDHRAKVAGLYVALGDGDFDGRDAKDDLGRTVKKKDMNLALGAYTQAVAIGVATADELRVRARIALAYEEVGNWAAAMSEWDRLVKEDPKGPGADPEAWLVGRARSRLRAGQRAEARADLREAQKKFPRGKKALEVLRLLAEERLAAAREAGNETEASLAYEEGFAFLRQAVAEHREAPEAAAVQRALAETLSSIGQHEKSAAEWRGLIERYPKDAAAPEWRHALAEALVAAGRHDEAVSEWKAFLSAFPNHPLWQQVQERIPQARFQKGEMYAGMKDLDGAITAWRTFAEEFPTHPWAPEALLRAGALVREKKDFEGAIAVWRGVTGRYAATPQAPQAWLAIAITLEDDLQKLEDAVKEYEELLKKHGGVSEAQTRLARLKGKHLEVRGERVIGSGESAVLKVVSRNLPSLKVKVYKLGLEDYFRRKQTVSGIEQIQVEIVKPDATADWKMDPYAPFALLSAERPVPTTGPGAYVVVAGDDDLTSTTLLLVSDVETVVKSAAGRQVFVWARNRSSGEPIEGARVLVSDGSKIFAEGATGKDGVYLLDTDKTAARVLVVKDAVGSDGKPAGFHAAATEWQAGQVFAEGWSSKAHISTDRPVYRPGQTMQFRAIYRRADGGGYRVPAKAKGKAVLVDPRGVEVERKDVVASDLGTFTGEFALDGEAPLGDWSVRLDVDHGSFTGKFRVLEYRKPEFTVTVTPAKPSYKTGEEGKATIKLAYTFGGAVVNAPVRWQILRVPKDFTPSEVNDYSWYFQDPDSLERARKAARTAPQGAVIARGESKTDEKGEASVSFQTSERDEDAEYVVMASAIDVTRRFVSDEGRIPVVRRDHWAVVRTDKKVYRPKQEIRATVNTVDANQTPVSKSGEAVLVRVKRSEVVPSPKPGPRPMPPRGDDLRDGKRPVRLAEEEIVVQTVAVSTDEKGKAEVRITAPGAGMYRVRWNSKDARGALVTAYAALDVSGEAEDLTKDARLVAAKETYTEGEKAEVLLQSPVTKVKALLTFEGEKVLAYRLIDVDTPSAMLEVPIEASYAPNIVMKVAIPAPDGKGGARLLEAEDEVVVFRYLKVAVTPSKRDAKPGDDVTFDVTTTDASDKPVAAEVGVSVVDEALFSIAPDMAPAIRPFFYDKKRVNRVVTSSSVGYRTYGNTRETNKDLLADAAARSGDPQVVFAQGALRLAREAMQRNDFERAAEQALAAAAADPQSWDARNLVSELRAKPEAQEALKRLDDSLAADTMRAELEKAKDSDKAIVHMRKFAAPGGGAAPGMREPSDPATPAPPRPAAAAPADGKSSRRGDMADRRRAGEKKDANESDNDMPEEESLGEGGISDAPFEGPAHNGTIGVGGGAGGVFKGRGGARRLSRSGGGGGHATAGSAFVIEGGAQPGQSANLNWTTWSADPGQSQAMKQQLYADFDTQIAQAANIADPLTVPAVTLRKTFADTAAFKPQVATDSSGKASFSVKLPDNLTAWRATARGIAGESLVGEGRATVVSRKDILLRVDAPRFLVQGDRATIPSVVHNGTDGEVKAKVSMKADGVTVAGSDGELTVPANGRALRDRDVDAPNPGAVRIEAEATSSAGSDKVEVAFGTAPRGIRAVDGRSGVISTMGGDVTETFLDVPEGAVAGSSRLTVVLYPGFDAAILDALTFLDLFPYGCVEQTVHKILPAAWAKRSLEAVSSPDAKRLADLEKALRLSVARLRNLMADDGSFGWWRGGKGDPAMTAFALLALAEARSAKIAEAQREMEKVAAALQKIVRSAPDDVQALCHWALAAAGKSDEEAYQITFRRRNEELSTVGLSWMAFAAVERKREFDAEELSRLIVSRKVDESDGTTKWTFKKDDCLVGSERLATALAVRALVVLGVQDDAVERGMRWLLTHQRSGGFGTTIETAAFVGACAAWVERARPAQFGGTVRVMADGATSRSVNVVPGQPLEWKDRRFTVDVSSWKAGRHSLSFQLSGEGEVRWAARLESTVASEKLEADEHGLPIERLYLDPELPPVEGAEMPTKPGHEILRPSARPKVEAKSRETAASGERVLVRLLIKAPRDLRYVTVEDPLPAGFEVLDETAAGPYDWQERRDDRQVFFLTDVKQGTQGAVALSYVLQAVHPGKFTALPARASALYLPEVNGRSAGHTFTVTELPAGKDGEAAPTPDERLALARKSLAKKDWAAAAAAYASLKTLPLLDEVVVECETALLRCALETNDGKEAAAKEIVRAREELVRRDAKRIPDDLKSARAIAGAYADIGPNGLGVAATLYRGLVARSFGLEAQWAETLKSRGREGEGLDAVGEALKAFPISNATAKVALDRATRIKDLPRPESRATDTRKKGAPMDWESVEALKDAAAHFAEGAAAGPASYTLVEALRRTRDLDGAVLEAEAFPRRFPDSPFVDDTLFFLMDSRLQKFEADPKDETAKPVLDAAQRLTHEKFRRPDGSQEWSEFSWRAMHAIGRVKHTLGDLQGAIEAYGRAAGHVEDAKEALAWLTETRLELEESTTSPVAGAAQFPLRYRNVGEVRLRCYPVDLQVLFAMRRTLVGLNKIDLSGIAAATEWTVKPADGGDHGWHEMPVDLPLGKDAAGVYLVVAKSGALETSTLILKTDLKVALQPVGEKVRVHVTDATGKGVRSAYVTVSDGRTIKARGLTDGRGVFEAPGVGATPFVVVNLGDRFAVGR